MRDRGALARMVDDGRIENVYRLQIMNATEEPQRYRVQRRRPGRASASVGRDEVDARPRRGALGAAGRAGAARSRAQAPARARTRSTSRSTRAGDTARRRQSRVDRKVDLRGAALSGQSPSSRHEPRTPMNHQRPRATPAWWRYRWSGWWSAAR